MYDFKFIIVHFSYIYPPKVPKLCIYLLKFEVTYLPKFEVSVEIKTFRSKWFSFGWNWTRTPLPRNRYFLRFRLTSTVTRPEPVGLLVGFSYIVCFVSFCSFSSFHFEEENAWKRLWSLKTWKIKLGGGLKVYIFFFFFEGSKLKV